MFRCSEFNKSDVSGFLYGGDVLLCWMVVTESFKNRLHGYDYIAKGESLTA